MAFQNINKGTDGTGAVQPIRTDTGGRTKISHGQPTAVTGTIDLVNDQVAISLDGFSDAVFYFTPLGSHVITFEQSADSTDGIDGNWFSTLAFNQGASIASAITATMTTAKVTYRISAPSAVWVRARVSTRTTAGVITVIAASTTASAQPQVTATLSSAAVSVASTTLLPSATVGGTITPYLATALTAKATIKATAGSMWHLYAYNPNTSDVYLQFFNTLLASVTLGTTAPIRSYWVPAGGSINVSLAYYQRYATGITVGPWSVADNSAGVAPTLGLLVDVEYI